MTRTRGRILLLAATVAAALASAPARATATACGSGAECGVPVCWNADVRTRPDLPRALSVSCRGVRPSG